MDDKEQKNISDIAKREEATLATWKEKGIFEKSLEQTKNGGEFVFYDGPPFATGLPHYGHILASVIKDAIPRYQTMKGRHVRRVWGWDCHGLPIENLIEQELGLGHKTDIEKYGIGNFNEAARASVFRYDTEWKKTIPRVGRFVDMEHSYTTMDAGYTESVWWAFKNLYEKNLIYQGFKSMHICPRCETTLSNNEVTSNYKDITDISVTVKFELVDEPGTYVLAWTTTPWTLPGNVALAISPASEYVKIKIRDEATEKDSAETYIVAKERAQFLQIPKGNIGFVTDTFLGEKLVGKAYKPVFDYYANDASLKNHERGWKIYGADFVTMDSGTGVVHIAPAFGEDDMALGVKENLPFIQHVGMDGTMKKEVRDFAGIQVKPKSKEKDGNQATDILIIKHLAATGALFSKEKIVHAYPHCWRCETPLLNYAAESWFVKVTEIKDKLLAENAKTEWVPKNMRDGRFGKWIEGARDWAISRSRYWGAPLPVWQCDECNERFVAGSRAELAEHTKKSGNKYFVMRHGEAESNANNIVSSKIETSTSYGLTAAGRESAQKAGESLKDKNIDIIITSPFARAKQTAEIVATTTGFDVKNIIVDERIKEIDTGIYDGKPIDDYRGNFASIAEKFTKRPEGGENLLDMKRRVMAFLEELEEKYSGKTILIVTHEYPVWMLMTGIEGAGVERGVEFKDGKEDFVKTGEVAELSFVPFPHNAEYEFDLHLPYIDEVDVLCTCGATMSRVPYVFDCWFESGSMPYAQFHYPFENEELFKKNFPADFIAEGVDQTRGWFYNMLVLSVGIFGETPFKNVIVNGLVLAEDGQKMSKKLKNYPDVNDVLNKYGADALRYYLLSSPIVHAEDLAFSEKGVDEVVKKNIARLLNVLSFYEMYGAGVKEVTGESENPLDQWIRARVRQLGYEMTLAFDNYELDRAVKPIGLFIDDLSTWYIRRSRDRFKSDDEDDRAHAIETTRVVLFELSKLLAPVMPFFAEHLYTHAGGGNESVHLESWGNYGEIKSEIERLEQGLVDTEQSVLVSMNMTRAIVADALAERAKVGIKVRQPLSSVTVGGKFEFFEDLVADEVNVKRVIRDESLPPGFYELDTAITPELKKEGQFRELLRTVQGLRKDAKLEPSDIITLTIKTTDEGRALIEMFIDELKKTALVKEIVFSDVAGEPIDIDGTPFVLSIVK